MDKNFDELAERFARRVYGGLKGEIRLAVLRRDLAPVIEGGKPLRVLDIGAGLGQIAIELACQGHSVTINDLSPNMLQQARSEAGRQGVEQAICWCPGPYQQLQFDEPFDLVLCHALLEWVDEPEQVIAFARQNLQPDGHFSVSFYNPAGKIYRNLIRGNFDWLDREQDYQSDSGSLTPNSPCRPEDVQQWLKINGFQLVSNSGIRVFNDYVVERRGGLAHPEQVLARELEFSGREPYKHLGRYLHYLAGLERAEE